MTTNPDYLAMAKECIVDAYKLWWKDRCPRCNEEGGYHLECWRKDEAQADWDWTCEYDKNDRSEQVEDNDYWDNIKVGGTTDE